MRCCSPVPPGPVSATAWIWLWTVCGSLGPINGPCMSRSALHTERLVPADDDIRQIVSRILALRALAPAARWANSTAWLLPRRAGHDAWYKTLRLALAMPQHKPAALVL